MTIDAERFEGGAAAGRLAGRRAFITGANSGIGEATARLFAAQGARVALVARRREELERVAADLPHAAAFPVDVADRAALLGALDAAEGALGPIDIVVNNAGIADPVALEDLTPDRWERTIAVNLSAPFHLSREAGLRMRGRGGGHIVNVASDQATVAMPGMVHYSTSKAALVGLTRGSRLSSHRLCSSTPLPPGPSTRRCRISSSRWKPIPRPRERG